MSAQRTRRILMPLKSAKAAPLWLYSGVVDRLVGMGAEVTLLDPQGPESALREAARQERLHFDYLPLPGRRFHYLWSAAYRYLFQTILPTSTNSAREEAMRVDDPVRYRMIKLLNGRRRERALAMWNGVRRVALPASWYRPVFEKHRPDLVVVGSMGPVLEAYYLIRLARQLGVRSLCTVLSWDYLTMKDYVLERPDKLIVWNEPNREEAMRLHGFRAQDIYVAGVPHFDCYFDDRGFPPREEWLASLGLDPGRKLLFVTPQPSHSRPRILDDVVETLAQALEQDRFLFPAQVLIRPHPSAYTGAFPGQGTEEDLRRYEARHPHIHGNRPRMSEAGQGTLTEKGEQAMLANLLHHADVVLDFFGTVSIEACALDTPVIYVDLAPAASEGERVQNKLDFREFDHLKHVAGLKGARIVETPDALISTINLYLGQPELDRAERALVARHLCYRTDGRSAERMAQAMWSYAMGTWPPAYE